MKETLENDKESSNSAHANGMNEGVTVTQNSLSDFSSAYLLP